MTSYLGIDIAKDSFSVCWQAEGKTPLSGDFSNDAKGYGALWRFLKKHGSAQGCHACMEATGRYGEALALFLHDKGLLVSVVNPARIKAYGQSQLRRNKTDHLDAALIADFCQSQQPPLWTPPPPEWYELQALVRHLDDLQEDLQRQSNRLDAIQHSGQPSRTIMQHLEAQLSLLKSQIEELKALIQQHIDRHPDLKNKRDLLTSIPGIGQLTASKLLAEIRYLEDFSDVRQLVAFTGLNPKHHQSGTSIRGKTRISKMGRASIRAALFMPAVVAKNYNPILKTFAHRLEQNGASKMEVVVAVMRKLLHLVFGILKSGKPFDPLFLEKKIVCP